MKNQKRKILFVCYGLGIGGIEKCLVNLLNAMPEEKYDVDILLMNPQYTFQSQITRKVTFINTFDYVLNIEDTPQAIVRRRSLELLLRYCAFRFRIKLRMNAWIGFKSLPGKYDIAIAYSHHDFSPYYVIDKVSATKKIMWYHNGVYEQVGKPYDRDKNYYLKFHHIVSVSSDCAKILSEKFEFQDGQLLVLKNLCDANKIRERAAQNTPTTFKTEAFHIVTVGRMTSEKGADLALEACRKLCEQGLNICWHWIGDGNQSAVIQRRIAELGLTECFILEGNQENPYPFIRCADIYVQPSYYEAYSTTITEAKVLGKPIVTTEVGGMRDQLTHKANGLIVPVDSESIADAIRELMANANLRSSFAEKLSKEDFSPTHSLGEYERTVFS